MSVSVVTLAPKLPPLLKLTSSADFTCLSCGSGEGSALGVGLVESATLACDGADGNPVAGVGWEVKGGSVDKGSGDEGSGGEGSVG